MPSNMAIIGRCWHTKYITWLLDTRVCVLTYGWGRLCWHHYGRLPRYKRVKWLMCQVGCVVVERIWGGGARVRACTRACASAAWNEHWHVTTARRTAVWHQTPRDNCPCVRMCGCVRVYTKTPDKYMNNIYIYIYTHTHTYTTIFMTKR